MAFLKSMRELNKLGRAAQKDADFGAMRKDHLASMGRMQEMMAAQTRAANIAATGIDARATVVDVARPRARSTSSRLSKSI